MSSGSAPQRVTNAAATPARRGPRPGPFEILADAAHGVVRREDEPDDRRDAGVGELVDRRLDLRGRVLRAEGGAEMVGRDHLECPAERGHLRRGSRGEG